MAKKKLGRQHAQRIELFCQALVEGATQADAYRRAYPASKKWKDKTVRNRAHELAKTRDVLGRVSELKEIQLEKHGASIDRVIQELSRIAFFDPRNLFDENGNLKSIHDMPEEVSAVLSGIEVTSRSLGKGGKDGTEVTNKVKFVEKNRSLELLGKWFKMWTDKMEHGGEMPPTQVNIHVYAGRRPQA